MKKVTLTFGLIAGALIVAYTTVVLLIIGKDITPEQMQTAEILGFLRYLILVLTVIFAMRTFRQRSKGPVGYWPVVRQGLFVTLLVALLVGLMEAAYMLFNPDFMQEYADIYIQNLQAEGAGPEAVAAAREEMEGYMFMANPVLMGLFYFVETTLIGGVVALIAGAFLRSRGDGDASAQASPA